MKIAYSDGTTVVDYPLLEENVVTHLAQRIVVDTNSVRIDSAHQNLDNAHLVLDGVLEEGQDYFKVIRSGETLVNCDYLGVINTHKMSTNLIDVEQSVDLYGDAAVQYVPQTSSGDNLPGYTYRFGKNQEELGDFSTQGDGLEFRNMPIGGNEILVQVNDMTPTIEIRRAKNPGTETFVIKTERQTEQDPGEKLITIDDAGLHVRRSDQNVALLTPGSGLALGALRDGFQTHCLTLDQAWSSESTETEVQIYGSTSAAEFRHIQNLEVCIDDRSQPSSVPDINARMFVKKWGVYRNQNLVLWVILSVDLGGELNVPSGRLIRLSFNNKLIL